MIAEIKRHLRLTDPNDDAEIANMLAAAEMLIRRETGKTEFVDTDNQLHPIIDDPVYRQCVKHLVTHWWENRGAVGAQSSDTTLSVRYMLNHIALCGDYR